MMNLRPFLRSPPAQTLFTIAGVVGAVIAVYVQWPTLRTYLGR